MTVLERGGARFRAARRRWEKVGGKRRLSFQRWRGRMDLEACERLQHALFGVTDRGLATFSLLTDVHMTGGEVLGAFDGEALVRFVTGYGRYVGSWPRLVLNMLAVSVSR